MGGNVGKIEKWKIEPVWTTQMHSQPWTYYSASASHNAEDPPEHVQRTNQCVSTHDFDRVA